MSLLLQINVSCGMYFQVVSRVYRFIANISKLAEREYGNPNLYSEFNEHNTCVIEMHLKVRALLRTSKTHLIFACLCLYLFVQYALCSVFKKRELQKFSSQMILLFFMRKNYFKKINCHAKRITNDTIKQSR